MANANRDEPAAGDDAKEPDFDLHQPHDHFFRRTFGKAQTASDYFLRVVPEDLRRFVSDPGRMRREDVSFISEELRGSQSDLLWRCEGPGGESPIYIYVLFEHQRESERMMVARLLFYLVKIWERHLASEAGAGSGRLPFILPLVLAREARLGTHLSSCGIWWPFRGRGCSVSCQTSPTAWNRCKVPIWKA